MDEFFQRLREIQKKERNNVTLSRVGSEFYREVHEYLTDLRKNVNKDPFSRDSRLLSDAQRIATEICERREHKITDSAIMNIQRSYNLFKGTPKFDIQDTTPLNLTSEEERLYFKVIDVLRNYRDSLGPSLTFEKNEEDVNSVKEESKTSKEEIPKKEDSKVFYKPDFSSSDPDTISESKEEFSSIKEKLLTAKIIENEGYQSVNKEIISQHSKSKEELADKIQDIVSKYKSTVKSEDTIFKEKPVTKAEDTIAKDKPTIKEKNKKSPTKKPKTVAKEKNLSIDELDFINERSENFNDDYLKASEAIKRSDPFYVDRTIVKNSSKEIKPPINNKISTKDKTSHVFQKKPKKIANKEIIVFIKEVPEIVCIDEKVYGPFSPEDVVRMPKLNAELLIKNKLVELIEI